MFVHFVEFVVQRDIEISWNISMEEMIQDMILYHLTFFLDLHQHVVAVWLLYPLFQYFFVNIFQICHALPHIDQYGDKLIKIQIIR